MGFFDGLRDAMDSVSRDRGCDWFCDECGAFLNGQPGFTARRGTWTCAECGEENDVSEGNILY